MYQRGIPFVLKVFLQEISENYLRVTPIRSGDSVIVEMKPGICAANAKKGGTAGIFRK